MINCVICVQVSKWNARLLLKNLCSRSPRWLGWLCRACVQISGVWPALSTALPLPSVWSSLATLLGLLSGVFCCAWIALRFDLFRFPSSTSSVPPQVPPAARPGNPRSALLGYFYMGHSHGASSEMSLELSGFRISISGPSDLVGEFVLFASTFRPNRARSPDPSVGSFEVVSSQPAASASGSAGLESRDQIVSSSPVCPAALRALGTKLVGATLPGIARIERAWTAGCWARAVLDSRVHLPCRRPPLDLRSRCYAVVRAESLDSPVIFKSSASYWRAVGTFSEHNTSVSQSFPSELEAKVYILAAGFSEEDIQVLP